MFGLTFEKLIIIGVIVAVIIGPQRLPEYARRLADLVKSFRSFVDVLKTRTESEIGVPLDTAEWNSRIREYDPREIVKHALNDDPLPTPPTQPPEEEQKTEMVERWEIVGGSSGHPKRRKVMVPVDEPTTAVAATVTESPE